MPRTRSPRKDNSSANLGFEAKLWLAADKLRSNMDAAEYKHVVLGLIFLKYIFDAFELSLAAKEKRRPELARLPFPEKVRPIIQLKEMAVTILPAPRKSRDRGT